MSENRFVSISFSLIMLAIALGIGLYFGGWAWLISLIPLWFGLTALKISFRATDNELSKLTGDLPEMTDDELRKFSDRIEKN